MPEVTDTPTYSLWKGKEGSAFQRVCEFGPIHFSNLFELECFTFLETHPDIYDLSWKHDNGDCWVVRRDRAERGGEE